MSAEIFMGGGERFAYPKWVWSYYGGWWPTPKNYFRNTMITGGIILTLTAFVFQVSGSKEVDLFEIEKSQISRTVDSVHAVVV
jgi:hypothetical protein